jgi:glutamine synthetase
MSDTDFRAFVAANPAAKFLDVLLPDLSATLRGKRLKMASLPAVFRGEFRLPGSMFALDVCGNTIEATGLGFDDGDADRPCRPLEGSLVPVPWMEEGVAQVQVDMWEPDGRAFFGDPRHVLAGIVRRFATQGLRPVVALEIEFYVIDPQRTVRGGIEPGRVASGAPRCAGKQINSMARIEEMSSILAEIGRACEIQGVPATSALSESGPGQYEVNLHHVADACLACDHLIRLKRIVQGIFLKHRLRATFMAKPYVDEPGSGLHIHVSLLAADGRNVFASDGQEPNQTLRHALGGLAHTMADSMLLFAPTINAYKRFRPECYVPLAPTWGLNNRGVALRIPVDAAENRRVEHRVAGADANPYLLTAAVLAGIHHGMTAALEPGAPVSGNPYHDHEASLPCSWEEALRGFERSQFVADYLGAGFRRLFATTRRAEFQAFSAQITPLEYDWYLGTA